jgi:hypothetical protein
MSNLDQPQIIDVWNTRGQQTEHPLLEQETMLTSYISPDPTRLVRNITSTTLTAYLPDPTIANGTAIISCPGGCFAFLPIESEGTNIAPLQCVENRRPLCRTAHLRQGRSWLWHDQTGLAERSLDRTF